MLLFYLAFGQTAFGHSGTAAATGLLVMALGGLLGVAGVDLPLTEQIVALSGIALGVLIALRARPPLWVAELIVGIFAIFHGYTHGRELPQIQKLRRSKERTEFARPAAKPFIKFQLSTGAGEGNRTLVCSLGSCRSTIELRPRSQLRIANLTRRTKRVRVAAERPQATAFSARQTAAHQQMHRRLCTIALLAPATPRSAIPVTTTGA